MKIFDNIEQKLERIKSDVFFEPYIQELKNAYEAHKNADTMLDYKSFMYYYTTGSRKEYEDKYFAKRSQLGEALMLYLLYEEEEYMEALCEAIWSICNELTWVLPAHLGNVPVADYRTHIDLFAAETAHSLAETVCLLGDKLPSRISDLIRHEVKERIFDAYESRPYFWEKLISNWPGVCASSIGMAYLCLAPERFENVRERIDTVLEQFMKSYGDDGSNTEGIAYWQYGFGMYLNYADMLYRFSEGNIDIRHGEKIDKMASFLDNFLMRGKITVSFSDGTRSFEFHNIGLMSYLAKNYEGISIQAEPPKELRIAHRAKPTWLVRNFLWAEPDCFSAQNQIMTGTQYITDAQWYLVKKERYSFAAKGGHNNEGHNHNDVGSFILATDKGQMLADLGSMEYTAACFSNLRYTLLQNSSLGHSVPIIDGKEQGCGEKSRANVVHVSDDQFVLELQEAYDTDIEKIVRTYEIRENGITIKDQYTEIDGHEIIERFISIVEPQITDGYVRIGDATLCADGVPKIVKKTLRNHQCIEEDVWLIDYKVTDKKFIMEIEVKAL